MDNFYHKTLVNEYESSLAYEKEIERYRCSSEEEHIIEMNISSLESAQAKKNVVVVVFSAMVLESFIYHYGSEHLGNSYYNDHLDRMNLVSKFIVIPRMVTQSTIEKSGQAYERLNKLVSDRNKLVHHKGGNDRAGYSSKFHQQVKEAAENAIQAQTLLLEEIDLLHNGETNYSDSILNTNECFA